MNDGFGARMCKKCAQSHRFGLGSGWVGGGGIPLGGGGVGEPTTGIMYIRTYIRQNYAIIPAKVYVLYTAFKRLMFDLDRQGFCIFTARSQEGCWGALGRNSSVRRSTVARKINTSH